MATDAYRVDQEALAPIGRMGFPWFNRALPESMFQLPRTAYEDYVAAADTP